MLKKQISYILCLIVLHLFLSQTFAFIISKINNDSFNELSYLNYSSFEHSFIEFNISTHANIWSLSKDENNKDETNLEIYSALYNELYHQIINYFSLQICNFLFSLQTLFFVQFPVYLFIQVFRL